MKPAPRMWTSLVVGFLAIGLGLFVAAGTTSYWQAWVYLVVGAAMSAVVTHRIVNDPRLLDSRQKAGPKAEQRPIQKLIITCTMPAVVAAYIIPGLDRRFEWSNVPAALCVAGDVLIVASMWMIDRVFRANSFGAATVQVTEGQQVISTGPYAIVRNPMYSGAAVYLVGLALALGSYWALVPSALTILGLVLRLFDEEALLVRELPGYAAYCARVRWHLVPGVF
jgi:protein-S-isoprenylcysteine O-methyltransferase Ste14